MKYIKQLNVIGKLWWAIKLAICKSEAKVHFDLYFVKKDDKMLWRDKNTNNFMKI